MKMYTRAPDVVASELAGEVVLVGTGTSDGRGQDVGFFILNRSAELLWESLAVPQSESKLAYLLRERFGAPEDSVLEDVRAFLLDAVSLGFVVTSEV